MSTAEGLMIDRLFLLHNAVKEFVAQSITELYTLLRQIIITHILARIGLALPKQLCTIILP
jgi:phage-related holin